MNKESKALYYLNSKIKEKQKLLDANSPHGILINYIEDYTEDELVASILILIKDPNFDEINNMFGKNITDLVWLFNNNKLSCKIHNLKAASLISNYHYIVNTSNNESEIKEKIKDIINNINLLDKANKNLLFFMQEIIIKNKSLLNAEVI